MKKLAIITLLFSLIVLIPACARTTFPRDYQNIEQLEVYYSYGGGFGGTIFGSYNAEIYITGQGLSFALIQESGGRTSVIQAKTLTREELAQILDSFKREDFFRAPESKQKDVTDQPGLRIDFVLGAQKKQVRIYPFSDRPFTDKEFREFDFPNLRRLTEFVANMVRSWPVAGADHPEQEKLRYIPCDKLSTGGAHTCKNTLAQLLGDPAPCLQFEPEEYRSSYWCIRLLAQFTKDPKVCDAITKVKAAPEPSEQEVAVARSDCLEQAKSSESSISAEIEKANYCNTADDCELAAFSKCPFGCYVYTNKAEADRIKSLIEAYEQSPRMSGCEYMCIKIEGVECKNKRCEPILPRPSQE